jgi:hypothetical protein
MRADFNISEHLINGLNVPSLDGDLFCSSRDPIREANAWVASIAKLVQPKSKVLVLGLGAGFHIQAFREKFPQTPFRILELIPQIAHRHPGLSQWIDLEIPSNVEIDTELLILEFRPAWLGLENEYLEIQRNLLHQNPKSFCSAAQTAGLTFTATAKDFQIKALDWIFNPENQSEEIKIWRALRELVQ